MMTNHTFIFLLLLIAAAGVFFRVSIIKHNDKSYWFVCLCFYSGRRRLFPASKLPKTSKTINNHRKAFKISSKPGARNARGTPRGRPGLKVPGNPPLKSPALGLLVPGDPHTLPVGVMYYIIFISFRKASIIASVLLFREDISFWNNFCCIYLLINEIKTHN